MAEQHTASHRRTELWPTRYLRSQWGADGARDLLERIDEDLRKILADHRPEPLLTLVAVRIDEILSECDAVR